MEKASTDIKVATQAEIRAQIAEYAQLERKMLAQMIQIEKAAGVEPSSAAAEEDRQAEDWARARLNGSAAKLLGSSASAGASSLKQTRVALKGVQKIIAALNRSSTEAGAIKALQRAEQLAPAESALVRDWALTTAHWLALAERIEKFYDDAGGDVVAALPASSLPHRFCAIEIANSWMTVDEALATIVAAGVVTAADLRKARSL